MGEEFEVKAQFAVSVHKELPSSVAKLINEQLEKGFTVKTLSLCLSSSEERHAFLSGIIIFE